MSSIKKETARSSRLLGKKLSRVGGVVASLPVMALVHAQTAAYAQLPTSTQPRSGNVADGDYLALGANTAVDWFRLGATIVLTIAAIGVFAASVWKFFEWRKDRAEMTDVLKIAGGGAALLGFGAIILANAAGPTAGYVQTL